MKEHAPYLIGCFVGILMTLLVIGLSRLRRPKMPYQYVCLRTTCNFKFGDKNPDEVRRLGLIHHRYHQIEEGKP